jgi:hypothetical protein
MESAEKNLNPESGLKGTQIVEPALIFDDCIALES